MSEPPAFDAALRWIDTHCHLDAPEFGQGQSEVRARASRAGVVHCVLPAVNCSNFSRVRALAHQYGDSYALGIHPLYTGGAREADLAQLQDALQAQRDDARLVAVGEIGIDLFVPGLEVRRQEHFFRVQLELAQTQGLPVIVHVRRSADRLLKHLRAVRIAGGIAHAFNGSEQQARAFIDLGFKLGFGGALTFDRALQLRRLAKALPADALVMETDAPDIPPQWLYRPAQERARGEAQGRNEPAELPRIAAQMARLRGVSPAQWAQQTSRNAMDALPRLQVLLDAAGVPPASHKHQEDAA